MSIRYKHLPDWLAENALFRRLFLMRTLYLERHARTHHSQYAEDVAIGRLLRGSAPGFYVDVGCYHPTRWNNTWALYRAGWRGINVDIDSIKVEGFALRRPQDINVASAVSDREAEVVYYSNGFYSPSVSMDERYVDGKRRYRKRFARARRLTAIIDDSPYRDRRIDLLSIDVEGHDLEVLKSLDFDRYEPRLVAVEIHGVTLGAVVRSPPHRFLSARGYEMVGWSGWTVLMASRSLQETLSRRLLQDRRTEGAGTKGALPALPLNLPGSDCPSAGR